MASQKVIQPLYQKTRNGEVKVGYTIVKLITNKAGEVLRSEVIKTKIYK